MQLLAVVLALLVVGGLYFVVRSDAATSIGMTLQSNPDLERGLVGHWTFDGAQIDWGAATGQFKDRSSAANHGTKQGGLSATTSLSAGPLGQALSLDGIDDFVDVGATGKTVRTVAFWMRPDASNRPMLALNGTTNVSLNADAEVTATGFTNPTITVHGHSEGGGSIGWYDAGYGYRKKLTIDHTLVSGSSDLTNFPVLVSLTDTVLRTTANGGNVTNASGYDIIFVNAADDTQLAHEIESYSSSTGEIQMWVSIPTLRGSTDTDFYLYYGNSGVSTSQEDTATLWSAYQAVYHLNGSFTDSANAHNGTNQGSTATSGKIVAGREFNNTYATVPDSGTDLDAQTNFSVSAWVKASTTPGQGQELVFKSFESAPWLGWSLGINTSNGFQFTLPNTAEDWFSVGANTTVQTGTWYHVGGVKTGTNLSLFVNGAEDESWADTFSGTVTNSPDALFFSNDDTNYAMKKGALDEVRIAKSNLSADWLATEYNNGQNQGTGSGKFIKAVASVETPLALPSTKWFFVAVTDTADVSATALALGKAGTSYYDGSIDDVRLYDRVLSAEEITRLYQLGATTRIAQTLNTNPALDNGLLAHWTFDGDTLDWASSTREVRDATGFGNNLDAISLTSTTSLTAGVLGQALRFNGTSDYLSRGGGSQTITFVNATGNANSSSATTLALTAFSVTTGNTIIVATSNYTAGNKRTVTGVTDTAGNTYTQAGSAAGGDSTHNMDMWVATNITGHASNVVTITYSGSAAFRYGAAVQYSGLATSDVYDVGSSGKLDGSNTTAHTTNTNSPNTTQADTLLLGFYVTWDAAYTFSASTPNALRHTNTTNTAFVERIATTTGAYSTTVNTSSANTLVSLLRAFKAGTLSGDPINGVKTVSFWVKPDTLTQSIMSLDGSKTIDLSSGTLRANTFSSPTIYINGAQTTVFPNTGWNHVTVVTSSAIDATALTIGKIGSSYLTGSLDDVRFYDRVLSSEEIKRLYELGATTRIAQTLTTNPDLERGLVGHWTFDGAEVDWSSTTAEIRDRSSTRAHGNAVGAMAATTSPEFGILGQAVKFNGTSDSITVGTNAAYYFDGTDPFTIATWFKSSGGQGTVRGLVERYNATVLGNWYLRIDGANEIIGFREVSPWDGIRSATKVEVGKWYHAVFTYDGTNMNLYVNGVSDAAPVAGGSIGLDQANVPVSIGSGTNSGSPTGYFPGTMDDVRIYARALTAEEVKRLYELGR